MKKTLLFILLLAGIAVFAQKPEVSNVAPLRATKGTAITITGSGFDATAANNIVFFGPVKAVPSAATTTSLTVTVPAAAGYGPLLILNKTSRLHGKSAQNFNPIYKPAKITISDDDFSDDVEFNAGTKPVGTQTIGSTPEMVVTVDLDGDGKPDLATVNNKENGTISVLRNTSSAIGITSGTFAAKTDFAVGGFPKGVAVGDIDGDGKPDLVVTNSNTLENSFSVMRNTSSVGTISFARTDFGTGTRPFGVAIGDIDGDGKLDVVTANNTSGDLSVFRNNSTGGNISFVARVNYPVSAFVNHVAIGDLDNDGKPELVADGNEAIVVLRNTSTIGSLSFETKKDFPAGELTGSVVIGDLDGDEKPDLTSTSRKSLTVLRNIVITTGQLNFSRTTITLASSVSSVTIGDINGDGKPDLATADASGKSVSVLRNTSNPGYTAFAGAVNFAVGNVPTSVALADVDGDEQPDLIAANSNSYSVSVLHNKTIPHPQITAISPLHAPKGTAITISGTGFNANANNNLVFFGAVSATPIDATETSLTVIVPAGATYAPVNVLNKTTTFSGRSAQYFNPIFTPNKGSITTDDFLSKVDFVGGRFPTHFVVGDFDGDGKPDLATVNIVANAVSVLRNTSFDGSLTVNSFAGKVDFGTGRVPRNITVYDLDTDGKLDILVPNEDDNSVSVLHNISTPGNIVFAAKVDYSVGGIPRAVTAGDLNADGRPDMAVAVYGEYRVAVLLNQSVQGAINTNSFASRTMYAVGHEPHSINAGDIDGDGKLEIITANSQPNPTVSVFRNISTPGNLAFGSRVDFAVGAGPGKLEIGDLDGDGKPDLAIANYDGGSVSILRNTSTAGNIAINRVDYAVGGKPSSIAFGDLDGDSKPDIATANTNGSISVLRNNFTINTIAANSLEAAVNIASGNPGAVSISDMDGDGKPDLVALNNTDNGAVSIFKNSPAYTPLISTVSPLSAKAGTVITITGSGFNAVPGKNVVVFGAVAAVPTASTETTLTVTLPVGATYGQVNVINTTTRLAGSSTKYFNPVFASNKAQIIVEDFSTKFNLALPSNPISVTLGDIDGDGKSDLAFANGDGTLSIYRNVSTVGKLKDGSMEHEMDITVGSTLSRVAICDLNGDGKPELVITHTGSLVSVIRNNSEPGNIKFFAKADFSISSDYSDLAIGDIDGDGKPDVATVSYVNANVATVLRNTSSFGNISFAPKISYDTGVDPRSVAIGDIDGDGKSDLITGNTSSNTISILRNTATPGSLQAGSFAPKIDFAVGAWPQDIALGDINGDGRPELVTANSNGSSLSILRNTSGPGKVGLAPKVDLTVGLRPTSVAIADMDGDGRPDLVATNQNNSSVSILQNASNDANTTFTRVDLAVSGSPVSIVAGDLDGDGKPDLVTANLYGGNATVIRNLIAPVSISSSAIADGATTSTLTIPLTVTFSSAVTGFDASDIIVQNGILSSFSGNGTTYTFNIVPIAKGLVSINVPSNVAQDAIDGENNSAAFKFNYQSISVVSISKITPSPTATASVSYQVTFSDSATGISKSNFSIETVGLSGASVEDVIISGNSCTVTVNTGAGSGTLKLNVTNSSGLNISNTPYTSGEVYTITRTINGLQPLLRVELLGSRANLDQFEVLSSGAPIPNALQNASFEIPELGIYGIRDNPSDAVWEFSAYNGVSYKESSYSYIDIVPDGNQFAYLHEGYMFQNLNIQPTENCQIRFRSLFQAHLEVFLGGVYLGRYLSTSGNSYVTITTIGIAIKAPTLSATITSIAGANGALTNLSPVPVVVNFSQSVNDFAATDIMVGNGSLSNFSGSGSTYTFNVTPTLAGALTINIPADIAQDGLGNKNAALEQFSLNVDTQAPTVVISSSFGAASSNTLIPVKVTFSENVTELVEADVIVSNGVISTFRGSGDTYTFNVAPSNYGALEINVAAGVVQDNAGNSNTAATALIINYQPVTISRLTPSPSALTTVSYQLTFANSVAGLSVNNFSLITSGLTGASISSLTGSGKDYTLVVNTGQGNGTLRVDIVSNSGITPAVVNLPFTAGETYTMIKSFANSPVFSIRSSGGTKSVESHTITSFIDVVQVLKNGSPIANGFQNASFENNNNLPVGQTSYNPVGLSWSFNALSGIHKYLQRNNNPYAPAPVEGGASALIESRGSNFGVMSQEMEVAPGIYQISFRAAQSWITKQTLNVFLDDVFLGSIYPTEVYGTFTSPTFEITVPELKTVVSSSSIASGAATNTSSLPFSVLFSQNVSGFTAADVSIGNGRLSGFNGTGKTYTFMVTPIAEGNVNVSIAAGLAIDEYNTTNSASNNFSFNYSVVLPVKLLTYTAKAENNFARLSWETASELNNDRFDIYRSTTGEQFTLIGSQEGNGTTTSKSNYVWYDKSPASGTNYYKLVQVNLDGKPEELGIKMVAFETITQTPISIYPNPASSAAHITFGAGVRRIELTDIFGKLLRSIPIREKEITYEINLGDLSSGTYFVKLIGKTGNEVKKLIKID